MNFYTLSRDDENAMIVSPELQPYVAVRIVAGQAELARWRLADGHDALALFSTEPAASAYIATACTEPDWQTCYWIRSNEQTGNV